MKSRELLVALNMIPGLGPKRIEALVEKLSTFEDFMKASKNEFVKIPGISKRISEHIVQSRKNVNPLRELEKAHRLGVKIITWCEDEYPHLLREIYDPPPVLYTLGNSALLNDLSVAIVGTRKATPYGKKVASKLAKDMSSLGINIVSGMARGIDTFAHKGALEAKGTTLAVWGSGIDVVYPSENRPLAIEISKNGCIATCFPLGRRPVGGNFPARNRIISGLSLGVVVVEAAKKSGSLITADFALEQGREVFAIPGSIFSPYSGGSHKIIKKGAKLVEDINDILEELPLIEVKCEKPPSDDTNLKLSSDEKMLVSLIDFHPTHIEEIIAKVDKTSQEVNITLTQLELKGAISFLAGGYVVRL